MNVQGCESNFARKQRGVDEIETIESYDWNGWRVRVIAWTALMSHMVAQTLTKMTKPCSKLKPVSLYTAILRDLCFGCRTLQLRAFELLAVGGSMVSDGCAG
jgi:hypothetical protein